MPEYGPVSPCGADALDPLLSAEDTQGLAQSGLPLALRCTGAGQGALWMRHGKKILAFASDTQGCVHAVSPASEDFDYYRDLARGPSGPWRIHRREHQDFELAILLRDLPADLPASFAVWADVLFLKAQTLFTRESAHHEQNRYERWFKTLDHQLRVLERERQKLAMLVNKSESGAAVFDAERRIRWVNPALAKRFGAADNPSALIGRDCSFLCHGREGCEDCPVKRVLKAKQVVHQERAQTVDNETRHYYVSAFPLLSPSAQVEEVLVTIQDLTDLETLRQSEARYNMLFQRSADAIFMADPKTLNIIMANRQAQRLTGASEQELTRRNLMDLHPASSRSASAGFYRRLAQGEALNNVETEVISGRDDPLTCNLCGMLMDWDGQQVMQVEYRDVTQLRALQRELVRADHLITLGTMNAGIAHEFKNRLAPLRAFAQMLTLEECDTSRLMRHSGMIVNEVDRLGNLVRDILDYARPKDPTLDNHDLSELFRSLVEELVEEYAPRLEKARIHVRTDIPENPGAAVRIDAEQLRRAYINLFKNSVEACESADGYDQVIHIQLEIQDGKAVLHMADTGCGIPAPDLRRIFDPFFSTKGPRGTGLGMCIVRSLVEANKGEIDIASEPGKGTTVRLAFDTHPAERQAA